MNQSSYSAGLAIPYQEALLDVDASLYTGESNHIAIIEYVVEPGTKWRVRYRATSWTAQCTQAGITLASEDKVYVVGRQGLTLLITPILNKHGL